MLAGSEKTYKQVLQILKNSDNSLTLLDILKQGTFNRLDIMGWLVSEGYVQDNREGGGMNTYTITDSGKKFLKKLKYAKKERK